MPLRIPNPINVTTQPAAALQSALGTLAFGGPSPYQVEAQNAQEAQRLAHALLYDAQTRKAEEEATGQRLMNNLRTPEALARTAGYRAGLPDPGVRTAEDYFAGRSTETGTMPPAGPLLDAYADAQFALRTGMADRSVDPLQIEKSLQLRGAGRRADQIRAGTLDPLAEAQAVYAQSGKAPFDNTANGTMNVLTGAETINPVGTARAGAQDALAASNRALAGQRGAETRQIEAQTRAGIGGRFGPPVLVDDPEVGPMYTAPSAAIGRPAAAKPLAPATAAMRDAAANLSDVRAAAGGFAPRAGAGAGRPQQPVALPGGNATILRMQETIKTWQGGNGLDPADRDLIVASATNMATDPASPFFRNPDGALEQIGREVGIESNIWSKNKIKDRAAFQERFPTARTPAGGGAPVPAAPAPAAAPTGAPAATAAVPPPAQRVPGQTYNTPRGPMKWTGTGWVPAGA